MELVWSPETALEAYVDTVKSCGTSLESSAPELVSAMAAGWQATQVVETWSCGGATSTSIGLAVAAHHTGGRHTCLVPDEESSSEYTEVMEKSGHSPEVIVGSPETAIMGLEDIDFMVVDGRRHDLTTTILNSAKLGRKGAVLIRKHAGGSSAARDFRWRSVIRRRIVRTVFLPVGKGLDVAYIGATGETSGENHSCWIKQIDQRSGEELIIRK
ncbi:hypothetical protein M569_13129 [Genlisea aurea]|uniref:Uncharacterized protein n=1 Tax=Genlisea aurea TaxID=192259 RepID=S8CBB1_9LAMI|nr:hypothetical protein M569_13129 [Genlisea aurea]